MAYTEKHTCSKSGLSILYGGFYQEKPPDGKTVGEAVVVKGRCEVCGWTPNEHDSTVTILQFGPREEDTLAKREQAPWTGSREEVAVRQRSSEIARRSTVSPS